MKSLFILTKAWVPALLSAISLTVAMAPRSALAGNTWNGGGTTDNWSDAGNWGGGAPAYGTIVFSGSTRTTNVLNGNFTSGANTNMNQVNFTGSSSWTVNSANGTILRLFDNGGIQAKVENNSTGLVTINAPITFAASAGNPFGEINAVSGDMTFGSAGPLTVNGPSVNGIKLFGGGRTLTFNNTISATGKWFGITTGGTGNTIVIGGSVTSGDWYVMNDGTLKIAAGGSISGGAVRLGGDFGNTGNQNQTKGGTLAFAPAAGGISFGNTINSVTGNTSNTLLIDSQNTSGTNSLTGSIFLDSDLKTTVASGGTLAFSTGTFDVKARKLTVGGAGTTTINQVLSSSLAAGGFLVKENGGTLILANTSNTYTGTNNSSLNANGTQISGGGILGIYGDGSFGVAPANAYNNIQFLGDGTLQDTANNISLHANRNISVATNRTATFDSNGNTFTVSGVVNGGGNVAKTGGGTVILAGGNTYTGTTSISAGTLNASVANALGATSNVTINTGGTLFLTNTGTTNRINNSATITMAGGTIAFSGNVAEGSSPGTGPLTLTANSIIDFAGGNAVINFGDSSGVPWTGGTTLSIYNWDGLPAGNGNDQIIFGIDNNALTASQLAQVNFYSGNGSGFLGTATILNDGELVPIPEPGAVFTTLGLLGLVGYRERRRRRG